MFELGKSDITSITSKVPLYQPSADGTRRKVGVLKITVEVLPRTEFQQLTREAANDCEVAKRLIKNIEPGDSTTKVPPYTPELLDEVFEIDWQFTQIFDVVMAANNERLARALRAKN